QVRFAEVNRQALTEAGIALFTGQTKPTIARSTTEQFSAPDFQSDGTLTFGDFLNLFVFNTKYNVGGLLKALQQRGLLQSLAEPNLIAYNGQEASFLAGGEVPVPVVQGGAIGAVSVVHKEFGIRLNVTPIIGSLFKNKSQSQNRTELMVLITPHLVRPLDPDEVPPLPTDPLRFYRPGSEGAGAQLQGGGGTADGPPVAAAPGAKAPAADA